MIYKVLSNLKRSGKFYSKGDEIEISEENAKRLVENGVLENISAEKETEEESEKDNPSYSKKTVVQLREICDEREIDTMGLKKSDLIEKLESYDTDFPEEDLPEPKE